MAIVGSILHGAYGDYYEQIVALRYYKQHQPQTRLVLFFASESRRRELSVLDLSFADEIHSASALTEVPVDSFLQFQVRDRELQEEILATLPPSLLAKITLGGQRKPWHSIRRIWSTDPASCDVGLSEEGKKRLPDCMRTNGIDEGFFREHFTVGFLWRYRSRSGTISSFGQPSSDTLLETKSDLLALLAREYGTHILIAGMNVRQTEENRERIDAKFTDSRLNLPTSCCTYLKGLSWALELEIMKRCSLCIVMASGFSEALWLKRRNGTVLVDPPLQYLAKLIWNRMPLWHILRPNELIFQLRQPHTATRFRRYLNRRSLLPARTEKLSCTPGSSNI